jgi:DNA helicase-2/ATP-dependent DNA helicase PcrA
MKERIGRLVGMEQSRYLQMGTFHSVFSRILRAEAEKIGFAPNFTIYDQADSRSLVKSICKELQLDDKQYKPTSVADQISMAKNHLVLPETFQTSSLYDNRHPKVCEVYRIYQDRCRQANAMDFDDLLVQTFMLFQRNEEVRRKYVERFKYVLVDEYQDTNSVQQQIVLQLTRDHGQVCVVGDDAQSIYSFRGANIDNILNFRSFYDNAKLFKLEQNYRSTQLIVQAANSLIRKNEQQIPKEVYSKNDEGEKLTLKPAYSDKEEAIIVCKDIQRIKRQEQCDYSDFAILYRTNSQSRSFEEQMRKDGIPYCIYGGLSFYQRKEIKDVIAYFRLVANPNDEEALKRIINYPARGIGDTTLGKIVKAAGDYGVSLWTVISQPVLFHLDVAKSTAIKIENFRKLVEGWIARVLSEDAYQLGHSIIMESGISRDVYGSSNPEDLSRQENLEEFLSGMQDFVESRREEDMADHIGISDFLQEVALLTDFDNLGTHQGSADDEGDSPKVSLMTVHSAKGLEFPTVFVVGLEENIFPSPMCTNSMREIEEERRLLYVAITRAEKHCILTCAENRFRFGRMEYDTPSRFIRDIDPSLLYVVSQRSKFDDSPVVRHSSSSWVQNPRPVATQFRADPMPRAAAPRREEPSADPFSPSFKRQLSQASGGRYRPVAQTPAPVQGHIGAGLLHEGNIIEHQRFGIGTVISVEGTGENEKATVEFTNAGTKQLLLKFAKFNIVK